MAGRVTEWASAICGVRAGCGRRMGVSSGGDEHRALFLEGRADGGEVAVRELHHPDVVHAV
jgi:hypothetical protein